MSSESLIPPNGTNGTVVAESAILAKLGFSRRYFSLITVQYFYMAVISCVIMLSPVARFYITENEWLPLLSTFLFTITYLSLIRMIKLPLIDVALYVHIIIQGLSFAILITYYDLLFALQTIVVMSVSFVLLFLTVLVSKKEYTPWRVMLQNFLVVLLTTIILNVVYGGTDYENILTVVTSGLLFAYHSYGFYIVRTKLGPADYTLAVVNLHLMPVNVIIYSSAVCKPD